MCPDSWATGVCRYGDFRQGKEEGGMVSFITPLPGCDTHIRYSSKLEVDDARGTKSNPRGMESSQGAGPARGKQISFNASYRSTNSRRCGSDTRTGHSRCLSLLLRQSLPKISYSSGLYLKSGSWNAGIVDARCSSVTLLMVRKISSDRSRVGS